MKSNQGYRAMFLMLGILFAWFALGIMFTQFNRARFDIEFGPFVMLYGWLVLWLICVVVSTICLGIGFVEKTS